MGNKYTVKEMLDLAELAGVCFLVTSPSGCFGPLVFTATFRNAQGEFHSHSLSLEGRIEALRNMVMKLNTNDYNYLADLGLV